MTQPRGKSREELTAEIENGKREVWQFEKREKEVGQRLPQKGKPDAQSPTERPEYGLRRRRAVCMVIWLFPQSVNCRK